MNRTKVKKLARFANAVHEAALANSTQDENPFADFIEGTPARIDRIRRWSSFLARAPLTSYRAQDVADELYYALRAMRDLTQAFAGDCPASILRKFTDRNQKPSHRMILKGIMDLAENSEFELDICGKVSTLVVPLPEFVLDGEDGKEHHFDELSLQFSLNGDGKVRVVVLGPADEDHDTDCPHPHVSDSGVICWGQPATEQVENLLDKGLLEPVYHTATVILAHYNAGSPYYHLGEGVSCHECGYTIPREEVYYCEHCSNTYCVNCYSSCWCGNTSGCISCLDETCANLDCNTRICGRSECSNICTECEDRFCVDCLEDVAGDLYCPTCIDIVQGRKREEEEDEEEEIGED